MSFDLINNIPYLAGTDIEWKILVVIYYCFWNDSVQLELSTAVCASFIFHCQAAQYAKWEKENRTANATACVVIFQNTNSARWTPIYSDKLCGDHDMRRWIYWIYGARRSIVDRN